MLSMTHKAGPEANRKLAQVQEAHAFLVLDSSQ